MDTLKRITVLLLAAALVYAGAAALHPPQARAGINAGVIVNNPGSQPVPVTGNVNATITGTTTVNFSNTPSTPIFTNPTPTPFTIRLCVTASESRCLDPAGFTVDGSRRLIIEYVTMRCNQNLASAEAMELDIGVRFNTTPYFFPVDHVSPNGFTAYVNQQTRIYADPGMFVDLQIPASISQGGSLLCDATVSGNLVTP